MPAQTIKLIDSSKNVLAIADVAEEGDHFGGSINLEKMPTNLRAVFVELEQIVNGQMFSFLDEIQQKIDDLPIKIVLEGGEDLRYTDLQIYPSSGMISFKLAETQVASMKSA